MDSSINSKHIDWIVDFNTTIHTRCRNRESWSGKIIYGWFGLLGNFWQVANAKEADLIELLEILDCFFDPDKQPVKPKTTWNRFANRRSGPKQFNKNRRSSSRSKKDPEMKQESKVESAENNENDDNNISAAAAKVATEQVQPVEVPAI